MTCFHLVFLQELCEKLHEQIGISEEERYGIEFKLNMVLNEVRCSTEQKVFSPPLSLSLSLSLSSTLSLPPLSFSLS